MNETPRKIVEGEFIQIKKIGNSLGLILSKDILSRLKLKEGDKLHIVEQTERGIKLSPYNPPNHRARFSDARERRPRKFCKTNRLALRRLRLSLDRFLFQT